MTNIYLSYGFSIEKQGREFHYLRAVFLPTNFAGNILLKLLEILSDVDLGLFFNIPTAAPYSIPAGSEIYNINGDPWIAPATLYKCAAEDYPISLASFAPGYSELMGKDPYVVYCADPPESLLAGDLPDDMVLNADNALSEQESWQGLPQDFDSRLQIIASRRNDYPFWTTTRFRYWWAYFGCEYDPEATPPYNLHHTLCGNFSWNYDAGYGGDFFYKHDGHGWDVSACHSAIMGLPLTYDGSGDVHSLEIEELVASEPVQWFAPQFLGIPPSTFFAPWISPRKKEGAGTGMGFASAAFKPFVVDGTPFQISGENFEVR